MEELDNNDFINIYFYEFYSLELKIYDNLISQKNKSIFIIPFYVENENPHVTNEFKKIINNDKISKYIEKIRTFKMKLLDISTKDFGNIQNKKIEYISCKELRKRNWIDDEFLSKCLNLKMLRIYNPVFKTKELWHYSNLEYLHINCKFYLQSLEYLSKLKVLILITYDSSSIPFVNLNYKSESNLRCLVIKNYKIIEGNFDPKNLIMFEFVEEMVSLWNPAPSKLISLDGEPNYNMLYYSVCKEYEDQDITTITVKFPKLILLCIVIQSDRIIFNKISDKFLDLQYLKIDAKIKGDIFDIKNISHLNKLKYLDICRTTITIKNEKLLNNFSQLKYLYLNIINFKSISKLKNLEYLTVIGANMKNIRYMPENIIVVRFVPLLNIKNIKYLLEKNIVFLHIYGSYYGKSLKETRKFKITDTNIYNISVVASPNIADIKIKDYSILKTKGMIIPYYHVKFCNKNRFTTTIIDYVKEYKRPLKQNFRIDCFIKEEIREECFKRIAEL